MIVSTGGHRAIKAIGMRFKVLSVGVTQNLQCFQVCRVGTPCQLHQLVDNRWDVGLWQIGVHTGAARILFDLASDRVLNDTRDQMGLGSSHNTFAFVSRQEIINQQNVRIAMDVT